MPEDFFEISLDNRNSYQQFVNDVLEFPSSYQGSQNKVLATFQLQSGSKYQGQVDANNSPEGLGKLVDSRGNFYEGVFKGEKLNGPGRALVNGDLFEGNFSDGKLDGKGKNYSIEGMKYEGEFKEGKKHGTGMETWENGAFYKGTFVEDQKDVKGTFKWPEEGNSYVGELKDGNLHGFGNFVF